MTRPELYARRTSMGTYVTSATARKVVRWTVRYTASHLLGPPALCGRCQLPRYCSSTGAKIPHNRDSPSLPGESTTELSVRCLLDMGFADSQAEHIYEKVCKSRGGSAAKHALSTLSALFVLGLNSASVLKLLEKCPELYTVKESQLQQRIANLRKLGLVEGSLQRVVAYHPQILTIKMKKINNLVQFLKERCLFTAQQVTDILRDSPAIIQEDFGQLEYKFQYVYFRMGVKQAEMVKSRLFRFTLDEVRNRHCFLERRGMYETPDKKGQTTIVNPKLSSILGVDEDTCITQVAKASPEEYDVFQRLMAREWQEEEHLGNFESFSDEEEEEEEEDKKEGKMAYMRRKKK